MNYTETLDYMYHKLPMFSRMGSAAFKKDLTNTLALCERLGNPHQKFKSIHVAGTNGKGSVSHMLAAIFQKAGYKTGLYTSPHLYDFRERIKINGEMIPENNVTSFVEKIQPVIEEIEPSFFEITVAMAFQYFAEQQVDIAIIEVGLGGRLDSTNVITPELSVITNIGWDHMNLLGNSLEEIAGEKAGIMKPNVPVVIGETLPETKAIFQRLAAEKGAPVYWAEQCFTIKNKQLLTDLIRIELEKENGAAYTVETDLTGSYQVLNVRTVLTAIDVLKADWQLDDVSVAQALKEVKKRTGLGGRWEVIHHDPMIVLDVAHNRNGMEKMMEHVRQLNYRQLHLVLGVVKDKEAENVLQLLPTDANYYFTEAAIPRALPAADLQQKAAALNRKGAAFENVNLALQAALANAGKDDLLLVCGSIFLVAEVDKSQYLNSPSRSSA